MSSNDASEPLEEATLEERLLAEMKLQSDMLRQLLPLTDLLRTPLDQEEQDMVIRLYQLMTRVSEELNLIQQERLAIGEMREALEAGIESVRSEMQEVGSMRDQVETMYRLLLNIRK